MCLHANILHKDHYVATTWPTDPQVAKKELALECDYTWELGAQARFKKLVESDPELVAGKVQTNSILLALVCIKERCGSTCGYT